MQTFVLAPKDPKTFYVLNDIFRYQDETYPEYEEEEVEGMYLLCIKMQFVLVFTGQPCCGIFVFL